MVLRLKNRVPLLTHTDAFFCLLASLVDLLQSLPGACGLSSQKVDKEPSMLDIPSTSGFGSHSCDVGICCYYRAMRSGRTMIQTIIFRVPKTTMENIGKHMQVGMLQAKYTRSALLLDPFS